MPKEPTKRYRVHASSVKLPKRHFALQPQGIEHVDIGAAADVSANQILSTMKDDESRAVLTKREKQRMKHETFMQRLKPISTPYSKSNDKRLRRKAREQIAGGMQDMQTAIAILESDASADLSAKPAASDPPQKRPLSKLKSKPGMIGKGKGTPLSMSQRKRVLELEQLRHPLILSDPQFASNPFKTVRIHSQNTLLKHQPST